jgi:hypothetical protein
VVEAAVDHSSIRKRATRSCAAAVAAAVELAGLVAEVVKVVAQAEAACASTRILATSSIQRLTLSLLGWGSTKVRARGDHCGDHRAKSL